MSSRPCTRTPSHRYPTAQALADDLNHWLKREPVSARPAAIPRRLWLWSRRSPGWAAAVALALMGCLSLSIFAEVRREHALEREQAKERQLQLLAIQRLRMGQHGNGWSNEVWDFVRDVGRVRRDTSLQAQASASLAGIDARTIKSFDGSTSALAFDPRGGRLLIGGLDGRLRIWDGADQTSTLDSTGLGVFAFRDDGTALQLVVTRDQRNMELRDVVHGKALRSFPSPIEGDSAIVVCAITPNASHVAAVAQRRIERPRNGSDVLDESGILSVWEATSGRLLRTVPVTRPTDIAISPDARLLAAGDEDGHIVVWPLPQGDPIATFQASRNRINCLLFGPDPLRREEPRNGVKEWLLASGDSGGIVTIWDLRARIPRSVSRGGQFEVFALAFRPDGMTLAAAGRGTVKLWDVSTGLHLLDVGAQNYNYVLSLAFSPDGGKLAVGTWAAFGSPGLVDVWELENDRGLQTLRGLLVRSEKMILSPEARHVAALSQDWQVGVWDRTKGQLLTVLDVPRGVFADNAALAFDKNGRRLAYSAGQDAVLWDTESWGVIRSWRLPKGFNDNLAFLDEQLLSSRVETDDDQIPPYGGTDSGKHPCICRIRDLLAKKPLEPIREIRDFPWHVWYSAISPEGRYLVVEGKGGPAAKPERICKLFESATGREIGSIPVGLRLSHDQAWFRFDPTGTVLAHMVDGGATYQLLSIPTLRYLGDVAYGAESLSPGGTRWFELLPGAGPQDQPSWCLHDRGRDEPLLHIAVEKARGGNASFSRDGRYVVWGQDHGTITICDLVQVQRRLAEVGMGW